MEVPTIVKTNEIKLIEVLVTYFFKLMLRDHANITTVADLFILHCYSIIGIMIESRLHISFKTTIPPSTLIGASKHLITFFICNNKGEGFDIIGDRTESFIYAVAIGGKGIRDSNKPTIELLDKSWRCAAGGIVFALAAGKNE